MAGGEESFGTASPASQIIDRGTSPGSMQQEILLGVARNTPLSPELITPIPGAIVITSETTTTILAVLLQL